MSPAPHPPRPVGRRAAWGEGDREHRGRMAVVRHRDRVARPGDDQRDQRAVIDRVRRPTPVARYARGHLLVSRRQARPRRRVNPGRPPRSGAAPNGLDRKGRGGRRARAPGARPPSRVAGFRYSGADRCRRTRRSDRWASGGSSGSAPSGAAAAAGAVVVKRALPPTRIAAFPLPADAVTPAGSLEFAAALAAAPRVPKSASATPFATASSCNVRAAPPRREYFPPMLEAIRGATSSVSLLMYGFKPGDIGEEFKAALIDRQQAGVEVRLSIDAIGSEVRGPVEAALPRHRGGRDPGRHEPGDDAGRHGSARPGGPDRVADRGHRRVRPPEDAHRRRPPRVRRRHGDRGPLQRRAVLRRHGPRRGPGRLAAPGALRRGVPPPRRQPPRPIPRRSPTSSRPCRSPTGRSPRRSS